MAGRGTSSSTPPAYTMPTSTHPPAVSLPAIEDADVPFSSLFDRHFDLATVEATAQLADRSVFVTSSGRRFLFESIPDSAATQDGGPRGQFPPSQATPPQQYPAAPAYAPAPAPAPAHPQAYLQSYPHPYPQSYSQPYSQPYPHPYSQPYSQSYPQAHPHTLAQAHPHAHPHAHPQVHPQAHSQAHPPAHPQTHPQPYPHIRPQTQPQAYPLSPHHPHTYPHTHPHTHPQALPQIHPQVHSPGRSQVYPQSHALAHPPAHPEYVPNLQVAMPRPPVPDAQPMYPQPLHSRPSVGYYQAPTRSEPHSPTQDVAAMMGQLSINRFGALPLYGESDGGVQAAETLTETYANYQSPTTSPTSPTAAPGHQHSSSPPVFPQQPYQDRGGHEAPVFSSRIANFDYGHYMAQVQAQPAVPPRTLPSLMEYSSPAVSLLPGDSAMFTPITPMSPYPPSPYEDFTTRSPPVVQVNGSPPPAVELPSGPPAQVNVGMGPVIDDNGCIDTQTAIVVIPSPNPQQASSSDGGSMTRDNVLPGEDMLFDGPVKSSAALKSPNFLDGQLRVFRNSLTSDLRFHCKVGNNSETYWIKGSNAQLVPVYAFDQHFPNVVYIRDTENDKASGHSSPQPPQASGRPSGIYQFPRLADLCDFQAKLTGEKVVLDIASVRLVRLNKMNSRSYDTYSSVRVQIWHEARERQGKGGSDVASFVTAGTALSGPLRERLVPQSSRLTVYLGRLSEYITTFITDDIEIKPDGPTMVKLKVRKAGAFTKRGSRWPGIKALYVSKHGSEPAGLVIHGQVSHPDVEASYDLYKTFEIDFENSPSQDNFLRKWDEVIAERRIQRKKLDQIQEDMEQVTFSGRKAREIW